MSGRRHYIWIILLLVLLLVNIGLALVAKHLYVADNSLRLDPLQLAIYPTDSNPKTKTRVVFFGDSRALSWPAPTLVPFEFINRGIGQQTSSQIQLRYPYHVGSLQADWLVVQMCVNDLKAIPLLPAQRNTIVAQCKTNLGLIIEAAKKAGTKVLLTTIFPLGKVPIERKLFWSDEVAQAIDEVNTYIKSLQGEGVWVLDTYALLLSTTPQLIKSEYSRDLLHLNAEGYKQLNTALVDFLNKNTLPLSQ